MTEELFSKVTIFLENILASLLLKLFVMYTPYTGNPATEKIKEFLSSLCGPLHPKGFFLDKTGLNF